MGTIALEEENRIQERIALVGRIAEDIYENVLPKDKVIFRRARIPVLVKGYFVLSECYKRWRIEAGHNTEPPKIAALSACAAIHVPVFSPINSTHATSIAEAKCNEIFAAAVAAGILGIKLDVGTPAGRDFWYRIFDIFGKWPGETLDPYMTDVDLSILDKEPTEYTHSIRENDKTILNALICIFELLNGKLAGELAPIDPAK